MEQSKPTTSGASASAQPKKAGTGNRSLFTALVIIGAIVVSYIIYSFVLGNPANFEGNNPENNAAKGNYLGIVYKGGAIVPILMSLLIIVLTFFVERLLTISKAKGANMTSFVSQIKTMLDTPNPNIAQAKALCDSQRGSVGAVVRAGLNKYQEMLNSPELDKDSKVAAIQKEIEEATTLELPMLERNLSILSTVASIATLVGLLGTVLGMIKAFAALATAGAPDAVALANGISEALINTALGIGTSALAIIFYNYFTTTIDGMTYSIDEAGYSVTQTFAATQTNTATTANSYR